MLAGPQEDLLVSRSDGSNLRRLTDDPFRDRGPTWSPDGEAIAFYSDRDGGYEIWQIRPDGSGLEQLTDIGGDLNFPIWAPGGRRIAASRMNSPSMILDVDSGQRPLPHRELPDPENGTSFWPMSWTPDGERLAGIIIRADGTIGEPAILSLARGGYEVIETDDPTGFKFVQWSNDGRHLLIRDRRGIWRVDPASHRRDLLVQVGGYVVGRSFDLSADDRRLTYLETATEGDIWLAEMR